MIKSIVSRGSVTFPQFPALKSPFQGTPNP